MEWTRQPLGDLVVDDEYAFVTERSSEGLYRCRCGLLPDWEVTGDTILEVFEKARSEVRLRKSDGRLPSTI